MLRAPEHHPLPLPRVIAAMNALTKPLTVLVASALFLAGCVSSQPGLYIGLFGTNGKSPPVFSAGEIPTIDYSLPDGQTSGVAIKVIRQPTGVTVRRQYAAPSRFIGFQDNGFDIDQPTHFETDPAQTMQFPGLITGNYTAELWIKGRLESSLNFSVSNSADRGPLPRHALHTPGSGEIYSRPRKSFGVKSPANPAVDQIDTFVGLTDEQKAEVSKIYLDEGLSAGAPSADQMEKRIAIREQSKMRIRALLTPGQQKLYDDDGSAGKAIEGLLERLDELVDLTPEQNAAVAKIATDESGALKKFTSIEDQMAERTAFRQSAQSQIRALLMPSQQTIYDRVSSERRAHSAEASKSPNAVAFRERVTYVGNLIKKLPAITARLGPVTEVKPVWGPASTIEIGESADDFNLFARSTDQDRGTVSAHGRFSYYVRGSEHSEVLTVYWEKPSSTAPLAIIKIEDSTGEVISP